MEEISVEEMYHALQIWNDGNLIDERSQIAGVCMVVDLRNMQKENIMKFFTSKITKIMAKYYQVSEFITIDCPQRNPVLTKCVHT